MLSFQQVYGSNSMHTLSVLMQMTYTSDLPNSVSRIVWNMKLVMSEYKNIDQVN
jgi:hypothetical protein